MKLKWIGKNEVVALMFGLTILIGCSKSCPDKATEPTAIPGSSDQELQKLLNEMSSSDYKEDEMTGERWFNYQVKPSDKALVPQMIDLLKHNDPNRDDSGVKLAVLGILGQLGRDAAPALPAIRECLEHHDRMVRGFAEETIEHIENPEMADKKGKEKLYEPAAEDLTEPAVEKSNEPTADLDLPTLLSNMSSSDSEIRNEAVVWGLSYQVKSSDKVLVPQMADLLKYVTVRRGALLTGMVSWGFVGNLNPGRY